MSHYCITVTSENFGSEDFEYATEEEAIAGIASLTKSGLTIRDGITRQYTVRTLEFPYRCDACNFLDEEDQFEEAQDLAKRLDPGGVATTKECPECGALAYPVQAEEEEPAS